MHKTLYLVTCGLLLTACSTDDLDFDTDWRDTPIEAEAAWDDDREPSSLLDAAPLLRHTSDGRLAAIHHRDHRAVFHHSGDPLTALEAWAERNTDLLGVPPLAAGERLSELELERSFEIETPSGRSLVVHRYTQRYRGHRVHGPGQTLAVTSVDGAAISIIGAWVDNRVELDGLRTPAARTTAEAAVERLADGATLRELEFVSVPERGTMAWAARIGIDGHNGIDDATGGELLLLAATGDELLDRRSLSAANPFNHAPVRVNAQITGNDPETTTTAVPLLPGSTWDGSFNLYTGWDVRMGDDRVQLYDLEFDNTSAAVHLSDQFYWGMNSLRSLFAETAASDLDQFNTQNMFHKLSRAVDEVDARMSGLGWDHAPGSPFSSFMPEPLTLLTNIDRDPDNDGQAGDGDGEDPVLGHCSDGNGGASLGKFSRCTIDAAALQPAYFGLEHSCIYDCDQSPATLLHEVGHYVDQHATFGIMGGAINSGTCIPGTTDEAIALAETIGDMTSLYLHRRLYTVDYTLSATDDPCTFTSMGQGTFMVHDASCLAFKNASIGDFAQDRPALDNTDYCDEDDGYRIRSINQAVWAWINSRSCSAHAPFSCSAFFGGDNREFMSGMMYAMGLSNAQSYETFFENIETYLWVSLGQSQSDLFRSVMATYGILPP